MLAPMLEFRKPGFWWVNWSSERVFQVLGFLPLVTDKKI